ncbi:MAG: metallo-dependent hydrolase [Phycisphaerales bacterium]
MKVDIIIRNGCIIDPYSKKKEVGDICIKSGMIVPVPKEAEAEFAFDATGMFVMPGLIDYHTHIFSAGTEIGIPADLSMIPQGVTTVVDAGSAGVANANAFLRSDINGSRLRIKAFLNVSAAGLATARYHENINPKYWDKIRLEEILQQHWDVFVGLKIRISKAIADGLGLNVLEAAVGLADDLNTRLAVHSTDPLAPMEEVVRLLRKGDILVHCFHGTGSTILDENGQVLDAVREAQERGVVMDAANGRNHWAFSVAESALQQGFIPDIISTDITIKTLYKEPVFGLPYVISKYISLGLPLEKIVACCTTAPAELLGLEGTIGTLAPGAYGDVSVFRLENKNLTFSDTKGEIRNGSCVLIPQLTVLNGQVLFRSL